MLALSIAMVSFWRAFLVCLDPFGQSIVASGLSGSRRGADGRGSLDPRWIDQSIFHADRHCAGFLSRAENSGAAALQSLDGIFWFLDAGDLGRLDRVGSLCERTVSGLVAQRGHRCECVDGDSGSR